MKDPLLFSQVLIQRKTVNCFSNPRLRSSIIILLWQFSTGSFFNLFLIPSSYIQNDDNVNIMLFTAMMSAVFLFSPLAGYVADVKFGRMKVLSCGTYILLLSTIIFLISGAVLTFSVQTFTVAGWLLLVVLFGSMVFYSVGIVLFLSNVIQFGIDQLRDAPTNYSVYFIYFYLCVDSISKLISRSTYLLGQDIVIDMYKNKIELDKSRIFFVGTILCISVLSTGIILFLVYKRQRKWFLTEKHNENPYKLVYNVLHFAAHHSKPIKRSAFTYCENERPSRLDFAKQRFGGPYTTEQVEDVRVLLNILKVIFAYGPAFLLESSAAFSFVARVPTKKVSNFSSLLFDHGIIVPMCVVLFIPLWLCVFKRILSRYTPNMFKRIGIALGILTVSFLVYLLLDIVAFDSSGNHNFDHFMWCSRNSSTKYEINKNYIRFPYFYLYLIQQLLYSFYHVFLYISAYELISCQSPEHMKGILFGLFYALRSLYQIAAAILLYAFTLHWHSTEISCHTGYCIVNFFLGIVSLIMYTRIARKYKYRKRDDICNIYKFAEDYYSTK